MTDVPTVDDEPLAEVIRLRTKATEPEPDHLKLVINNELRCRHQYAFAVDFDTRVIRCSHCGVELSHWEALRLIADDYHQRKSWRDHVRTEKQMLEARIEVMKRLQSKLLQQLRKNVERAVGQKVDGWTLRNAIDQMLREAAREVVSGKAAE